MKFKHLLCAAAGILMTSTSCAQNKGNQMNENQNKPSRTLVTYFSATGNTRKAANDLAEVIGADVFEIKPTKAYSAADLDWTDKNSRCYYEMHNLEYRPEIQGSVSNLDSYDTVFIGFPIWWYIAPTIVNSFIEANDLNGKRVICFATSGGSPIEPCVENLKKQYPSVNWAGGRLLNVTTREDIAAWVKTLGL